MATEKTILFGYSEGEYTQRLKVRSENLPFSVSCDTEWVTASVGPSFVCFKVSQNNGFSKREASVVLADRFGNRLDVKIVQDGFTGLRVDCPDTVVVPYTHYAGSDSYDVYATVYGGPTKGLRTRGLTNITECVWKASDTYRDYKIHIPEGLSGTYTLSHSDTKAFSDYCKENGIEFDESSLKRKMTIIQLTESDMVGTIEITCGSKKMSGDGSERIGISYGTPVVLNVRNCSYSRIGNDGKIDKVTETKLVPSGMPEWLELSSRDGYVVATANRVNPFEEERRADIKLSSPSNPRLSATFTFVQESSVPKG